MLLQINKNKRSAYSVLLLMFSFLFLVLAGRTSVSAATIQSPKANMLFVSASVPSGFNNAICILLKEQSTDKTLTLKFDCSANLSVNTQLDNGTYEVLGVYTSRHSDQYAITCDTARFTIGDGTSPMLALTVQARANQATGLTSSTDDTSQAEIESDASVESSAGDSTVDQMKSSSIEAEETDPSEQDNSTDTEEEEREQPNGGMSTLKLVILVILALFAVVLLFSLIGIYIFLKRNL